MAKEERALVVTHYLPFRCQRTAPRTTTSATHGAVPAGLGIGSCNHGSLQSSVCSSQSLPSAMNGLNISQEPLPVSSSTLEPAEPAWQFTKRRDHSALYAGILSLQKSYNCTFIGYVDKVYDANNPVSMDVDELGEGDRASLVQSLRQSRNAYPVFLDSHTSHQHYEGFCKICLWPLFHYIVWSPTDGRKEKLYWDAYQRVNQQFANIIAELYEPGDKILIHDYHFLLVPSMLRKLIPDAVIGFFLHTPFPSSEIFRCLPQRKELLLGMLGANLIGFQTYSYARHFISSSTRILGVESTPKGLEHKGSLVSVGIFPIGIDVEQVELARRKPSVAPKIAAIREMYAGKKIIIGRDKLDQIKGVQHKLCAFEKFLELYPEFQGKVVLIQVTSPAETSTKLETKVSEIVSRINGHYGSLGFAPVHHYHHLVEKDEYHALLTVADVALITSVRDEFTGTAGSLSAAILVNPWDYFGVADAIYEALTMTPDEKKLKHQQLYNYITKHTADFWANQFISELILTSRIPDQSNPTPLLDMELLKSKFQASKKRMFFLDYDGTLTPIRKTPNAAVPPKPMLEALDKLVSDENTIVFVISGRDQTALDLWLGHIPRLGLSAEHGCFIKYPSGKWINLSQEIDLSWKNDVLPIFEYYTERTPGSFIEHKASSLTWHYRLADPEYGSWQAKECYNHLENVVLSKLPVEVLLGKKNLEVRPQQINKGEIVKRLLQQHPDFDFIFCAGDDKTDEDMFKSLKKLGLEDHVYFNCTIGSATKKTQAAWHVPRSEDLVNVLRDLAAITL